MKLKLYYLAKGHEIVVGLSIAKTNIRNNINIIGSTKFFKNAIFLVLSNKNTGFLQETRCTSGFGYFQLGSKYFISSQEILSKMIHHDRGIRGDYVPFAKGIENSPRIRVHIFGIELGQHGPGNEFYVTQS